MDGFMLAFIFMLVLFLGANIINQRAIKKLEVEQVQLLVTQFASQRLWSLGLMILLIIGYFAVLKMRFMDPLVSMSLYFAVLLIFLIVQVTTTSKKLRELGFDSDYLKSYKLSTAIKFVAIIGFCLMMISQVAWK